MPKAAELFGILLLICIVRSGPANAIIVEEDCHQVELKGARGIDQVELGGTVVLGAAERRCTVGRETSDVDVTFFSPVHLVGLGVCVSAVYDTNRAYSGSLLRQRATRRHCPLQGYRTYVETWHISDTEFLAILQYWSHLDADAAIDSNDILARFAHPTGRKELERLLRHVRYDLRVRKPKITFITGGYKSHDFALSAKERKLRSYQVGAGGSDIYLVAEPTGFKIYGVDHPIP